MRRYLFIFIGVFTLFMVACRSNKYLYYQDYAGLDTNIDYGYAVPRTLFMSSGYVDSLRKRDIRIYNNPIFEGDLEGVICYYNRNCCKYPENGNDFWSRYYVHDRLNNFKGLPCQLRNGFIPASFDEYMEEITRCSHDRDSDPEYGFSRSSLVYDREYIDFYDFDSVVISSNSNRKVSGYVFKPEYLYKKISAGEIEWGDLICTPGALAPRVSGWAKPGFYTSDSINILRSEECAEGFLKWGERFLSFCDSIVAANKLDEKETLSEYMLWFDKEENVISECYGRSLPDEIVSDSNLKRVLQESFEYADKRTRYFRCPFSIEKRNRK